MSTYKHKHSITIDESIAKLFCGLIPPLNNMQLYSNRADHCHSVVTRMIDLGARATVLFTDSMAADHSMQMTSSANETYISYQKTNTPEMFDIADTFHISFGVFPFDINNVDDERIQTVPIPVQDKMQTWKVSEGKTDRIAPLHLIGLEGLLRATQVGGYFGAVVPRKWVGREMTYMQWWNTNVATVAVIDLPETAMMLRHDEGPRAKTENNTETLPGKWQLMVFNRPLILNDLSPNASAHGAKKKMPHAEIRHTPFVHKMLSTSTSEVSLAVASFKKSEWYSSGIKLWHKAVTTESHNTWCGTYRRNPRGVPDLREMHFFEAPQEKKYKVIIEPAYKIKKDRQAVQVKITSRVKLYPQSQVAAGQLMSLKLQQGFKQYRDGSWEYTIDEMMRNKSFSEIRDNLVTSLEDFGLRVYMTPADYHRFEVRTKWLQRQLIPIERTIPVQKGKSLDQLDSSEDSWELIYGDSGMESTIPEIVRQWRQRSAKARLAEIEPAPGSPAFGYQCEDNIRTAPKDRLLNAYVMGLGKTLTEIMRAILRGVDRVLIICPTKLVDVWRDEIKATIGPWARKVKRNWNGKLLDTSVNTIAWGSDCEYGKLRFFNIIGYDTLKRTPKDAMFYKCEKCGAVSCKKSANGGSPSCPGNTAQQLEQRCSQMVAQWKKDNADKLLRKYKTVVTKDGERRTTEDGGKIMVHWRHDPSVALPGKYDPESGDRIITVDDRPAKPKVPLMTLVKNMHKKQIPVPYESVITMPGGNTVRTTKYKWVDRDYHVAWTFADILRNRFNYIIVDEAQYLLNAESAQTQAVTHLCGRVRVACSGTPTSGFPQSVLPLFNWLFARETYPNYRLYNPTGVKNFIDKFKTEVTIVREGNGIVTEDGEVIGGQKKQIPKIGNPELFQAEIAPFMIRRVRTEPDVVKYIPRKVIVPSDIRVEMDPVHRQYYEQWIAFFAEWWQEMKEAVEGKKVPAGQLITKLTYLSSASSAPHSIYKKILESKKIDEKTAEFIRRIGPYNGPPVQKVIKAINLAVTAAKAGDKAIIFSGRHATTDLLELWAKRTKVPYVKVDGRTPLTIKAGFSRSERHEIVESFRNSTIPFMFAGVKALAEGMNIPEANHGIVTDTDWDPKGTRQALGRMIRPAQSKTVYTYQLMHKGAIDEYQVAWCYLKGRSSDEGIDYIEFDDFSSDIIPDIHQYADSIVDGTEDTIKAKMWLAVDHYRKLGAEEGDDLDQT